jgi:arylformamidase
MKYTDISVPLSSQIPKWPGSIGFSRKQTSIESGGNSIRNSEIHCDVHVGTHIDAPAHHLAEGATVDKLILNTLIGPATIIEIQEAHEVTASILAQSEIPQKATRLLIKTQNSQLWKNGYNKFLKTFIGLKPDAAEWLVQRGIRLVGIDYLSVQPFNDDSQTHTILLGAGVIIVEGLDLSAVKPGQYHLICLPLNIVGSEGAPARAVVCRLHNEDDS